MTILVHSGQAVAALSPSIQVAATINPFLLVIFGLFCGVTIVSSQLSLSIGKDAR